ncbi:MAG: hypothetical protein J6A49_01775, partial [Clostridia bacterium]|nr:hypothetical protein [Clostridia bacterium]
VADYEAKLPYTQKSANGLVAITDENQNLLYTTTPTNFADSGFCLIKRDTGRYDWFSIKVVPASNVLFEENYVVDKVENSDSWAKDGDPVNTRQSITDDETDVYGYDAVYETTTNDHSNGSAIKTSVKADSKRSTVKSFEFIGEGFDLISACGANTGIMAVSVKNSKGEIVKGYLVDTYYSAKDGNIDLVNSNGLVCQVPVINFRSTVHDTYTVETTALYLSTATALKSAMGTTSKGKLDATTGVPVSKADAAAILASYGLEDLANADLELVWFDDNSVLNGGSGAAGNINTRGTRTDGSATKSLDCYIDGFRIYKPMSEEKVDYIEKEQKAVYYNVINSIKNNQMGTDTTQVDGIAYVETAVTEGTTLSFANYEQFGPQNELYLKGGSNSALVIKVLVPAPTSRVHLGLRAVTGTATVKIGVDDPLTTDKIESKEFNIYGPTEMYYDVTDCVTVDNTGVATITIQNSGTDVLAVNNIKLTGDATMTMVTADDMDDAYALMTAPAERAEVINGVVTPVVEDTDTDTDNTGSSNLSFIEQIIAKIIELLSSIFKFIPVGEVM